MDIILVVNLLLVALLIGLTAFFVGSEFAVVKVRMSRLDQLIAEGNSRAVTAKKVAANLDYYLSACQLGITVTALGLGFLGKPTVERILYPLFESFGIPQSVSTLVSYIIAFSVVTFLHVVVGELAPKTLAIQFAEKMTLQLAKPLYWFGVLMAPLIWTMNGSARLLLRSFGVQPAGHEHAHSEEELKIIMAESYKNGEINKTELSYMENIFAFDERVAKDIMVPRTQMVVLTNRMSEQEIMKVLSENQYTRYPVTEDGDKDRIAGFINLKKLFADYAAGREFRLADSVQELPMVHENTPLQEVLRKMQKERVHIFRVLDEYGGTAGLVTMEDLLEVIVGDIQDEFDTEEIPDILQVSDGIYQINGRVLLSDLEKQLKMTFKESKDVDTIGGWLQFHNMNISAGESLEMDGYLWTVQKMNNYQITEIRLQIPAAGGMTEEKVTKKAM